MTSEEEEWYRDLDCAMDTDNDEYNNKPTIAKLCFENKSRPFLYNLQDHVPPYIYQDEDDRTIDRKEAYYDASKHEFHPNEHIFGEIMTGEDMEETEPEEPIINLLKNSGALHNNKWKPSLPSLKEETKNDLRLLHRYMDDPFKRPVTRRIKERVCKLDNKLQRMVQKNNGLYRIHINTSNSMQNDGGANRSVTNNKNMLIGYQSIDPYPIGGVNEENGPAILCTGKGYIPWRSNTGEIVLIRSYYCAQVAGTIISPTDIVMAHNERFSGWTMDTDCEEGLGEFTLKSKDGLSHLHFDAYMENNLWYHYFEPINNQHFNALNKSTAVINKLTDSALYELWHHRLGHPGKKATEKMHANVNGVPHLRPNQFHCCTSCMIGKFKKTHIGKKRHIQQKPPTSASIPEPTLGIGENLHMDYGFVRGSDWSKEDNDGKLVTSVDNFRSYLIVVDRASRYIWVYLTKTKHPPVEQVQGLLSKFKGLYPNATVTTDQGRELGASKAFQKVVADNNYKLHVTGAETPQQNALAEKPNQDLAKIMKCLLYSSGLGSQFWSYALRHAVYLKNRRPHASLQWKTPYEKINGKKPDLSRLKIFGAKVQVKDTTKNVKKLDRISSDGIFMTYKGSDKLVYVVDKDGKHEQCSAHVSYDEAHMSTPRQKRPPMSALLEQAGYRNEPQTDGIDQRMDTSTLKITSLSEHAFIPQYATDQSAGLDLHSAENAILPPGQHKLIHTDIAMEIPPTCYGQICSRSGLVLKHRINVQAGTIDSDYRGEIGVVLTNEGDKPFHIHRGDRIAQLIIKQIPKMKVQVVEQLSDTNRSSGGFGSTGVSHLHQHQHPTTTTLQQTTTPSQFDNLLQPTIHQLNTSSIQDDDLHIPHCNVELSSDPFYDKETITLKIRGKHPTQGLNLISSNDWDGRIVIDGCQPGTPGRRIRNWTKRIKHSLLHSINNTPVTTISQASKLLGQITASKKGTFTITVSNDEKSSMHTEQGVPMLFFDQLATISSHLHSIKYNQPNQRPQPTTKPTTSSQSPSTPSIKVTKALQSILPKNKRKANKLTRRKLKLQENWPLWLNSEWRQLDQYEDQQTFGLPCELPIGANVLDLLWTYLIKTDGTLKARCVCNGQPSNKNTAIFGYTFAKMLDHVGACIFWAACASKNFIVRGADASNAFAEADAPKIPLYVRIDTPYREWWTLHKHRQPIPDNYVLPVKKALQGHPESSRSWATLIDGILQKKLGLKPTSHEPCLYTGTYKGKEVLFLRQVDDFAVASDDDSINIELIKQIDSYMTIEIKDLGRLNRYNGVDITQGKHYIKLSNATYINKVLEGHEWLKNIDTPISSKPLPIKSDNTYIKNLEKAVPPNTDIDIRKLQLEMGLNYRQAIGELIYVMITCRPDISFPLIKLSQYSKNPAREHYEAVKHIFQYLQSTVDDGLYFWRPSERADLPPLPFPKPTPSPYTASTEHPDSSTTLHGAVDSDWAGDTNHRKSVTGMILRLAGGTLLYKTKYQDCIATSSTEAEFAAACEAGKAILYIRSILDEINIPQDQATPLFIDNNGALMMGNAQQPTRRTKHMDIKHLVLQDWVKRDLILMKRISTSDNYADSMTKALGRQLHYRHNDYILGKHVPPYINKNLFIEQLCETSVATQPPSVITDKDTLCSPEHGGGKIPKGVDDT